MTDLPPVPVRVAGQGVHDAVVEGEVHGEPDGEGDDHALEDVELPAQEDQGGQGGEDDQEHAQDGQQAQTRRPGKSHNKYSVLDKTRNTTGCL